MRGNAWTHNSTQAHVVFFWDPTSLHTCKTRERLRRLETVSCCFLSPLPSIAFLVLLPPSSNPSIQCCRPALCGESAVTVCPSSCGPSCLSQMGPSLPHPLWATVPIRGHQNLKRLKPAPEAWKSHGGKTIWWWWWGGQLENVVFVVSRMSVFLLNAIKLRFATASRYDVL